MRPILSLVALGLCCLLAVAAVGGIVLAAVQYEPPNPAADGPQLAEKADTTAELLTAAVVGCGQLGREPLVGIEDGVVVFRCVVALPSLGVVQVPKGRFQRALGVRPGRAGAGEEGP